MIEAICTLLGFELLGELARGALHLPVPGPVAGMLLLTLWLALRARGFEPAGETPASPLDHSAGALLNGTSPHFWSEFHANCRVFELHPDVGPLCWALSSICQLWRAVCHQPICQRYRHLVADRAMRSNLVVVYTPILAFSDRVVEA